ncbi:hypothetical protein DCAR_0833058 [Daucus carota subsp. sativus]|uniref:Protein DETOXIFICATION n=1 Tax=Daucus carota subsp. sativus TaxID=79200 RepID=A0AAF0XSL8_DAUCS|nr:hypothetical protein DCAR_0833058 [Daucus carota subsp. sativus]
MGRSLLLQNSSQSRNFDTLVNGKRLRCIDIVARASLSTNYIQIGNATNPTHELITLSLPAILGQAIDPFAQLMETAFIGRLGPVELASAGVSISIFNIVSKLFNIPLLSVATSFVAEDISRNAHSRSNSAVQKSKRWKLPSMAVFLYLVNCHQPLKRSNVIRLILHVYTHRKNRIPRGFRLFRVPC